MYKISLIVPVYNVKAYLKECLDSCIAQTYSNIEIICIDDLSTDGSVDLLYQYQTIDPRIRIIQHKVNMGLGGARNSGIEAATGDYIWFIDGDDRIELNACEKIGEAITLNTPDMIIIGLKTIPEQNGSDPFPVDFLARSLCTLHSAHDIVRYLLDQEIISACLKVVRRNIIRDNFRYLPGTQVEDLPTIYMATKIGSMTIVPEYLYLYRRNRPGSITATFSEKFDLGYINNLHYLFDLLDNGEIDKGVAELIKSSYCGRALQFSHIYRIWTRCSRKTKKNCFMICSKIVLTLNEHMFKNIVARLSHNERLLYMKFRATKKNSCFLIFDCNYRFLRMANDAMALLRKLMKIKLSRFTCR